jgi:hypothetical protein
MGTDKMTKLVSLELRPGGDQVTFYKCADGLLWLATGAATSRPLTIEEQAELAAMLDSFGKVSTDSVDYAYSPLVLELLSLETQHDFCDDAQAELAAKRMIELAKLIPMPAGDCKLILLAAEALLSGMPFSATCDFGEAVVHLVDMYGLKDLQPAQAKLLEEYKECSLV